MIKATDIKAEKVNGQWFTTAKIELLDYQHKYEFEPTDVDNALAVMSFEHNYAGLIDSQKQPVEVVPHHSEVG